MPERGAPALGFEMLDRHVVHGRADGDAVVGAAGAMTYARLLERSAAVAAGLRFVGVQAGDPVAVAVDEPVLRVTVLCACIRLGAVPGPVGDVRVESGPDGAVVRTADDEIELETLRKVGATDPVEALDLDAPGYRAAVEATIGDVVQTLLAGGTVS